MSSPPLSEEQGLHHNTEFSPFPGLPEASFKGRSKSEAGSLAASSPSPSATAAATVAAKHAADVTSTQSEKINSRPRQPSLYVSDSDEEFHKSGGDAKQPEPSPSSPSPSSIASIVTAAAAAKVMIRAAATVPVPAAAAAAGDGSSMVEDLVDARLEEQRSIQQQRQVEYRELQIMRYATACKDVFEADDVHWRLQQEKLSVMVQRMYSSRKTCEEIEKHLKATNKLLTRAVDQVGGVCTTNNEETGTLKQALIAQDILRSSFTRYLGEMRDRVFTNGARQASALSKNLSKEFTVLESKSNKLFKKIKGRRAKARDSWANYEKALAGRSEAEVKRVPIKEDPFVACRSYEQQAKVLEVQRNEYHVEMDVIFRKFQEVDRSRVDATKAILLDNLLAQRAVLHDVAKFTDTAIEAVKQIDAPADVDLYTWEVGLMMRDQNQLGGEQGQGQGVKPTKSNSSDGKTKSNVDTSAKRTVFSIPSPSHSFSREGTIKKLFSLEIEHEGVLFKQGRIFKSSWTKVYGCLSKSGFLHIFAKKSSNTPEATISVLDAKLGRSKDLAKDGAPLAFYLETLDTGIFAFGSTTVSNFKTEDDEALDLWLEAIEQRQMRK